MTTQTKSRGFTIVELLIVIVIIAILAAITIVAYNGITNRANASSAKAAANSAIKKMEAYNADDQGGSGSYPATFGVLTASSAASTTYYLTGVSLQSATTTAAPSSPSFVKFFTCATPAGISVAYYDYASAATDKWTKIYAGGCTSSSTFTQVTT